MVTRSKKSGEKTGKLKVGKLELKKETVKDLTGIDIKAVKGGLKPGGGVKPSVFDSCYATDCCLINPTVKPCNG